MKLKRVIQGYFSPTGTVKKSVAVLSEGFGIDEKDDCDLSPVDFKDRHFSEEELLVLGIPVFGGRVPALAAERIKQLSGSQTPAVAVAAYGNRAFEDALVELQDLLEERGFVVIAGVAAVTEHSIVRTVATGQPDEAHCGQLRGFGEKIIHQLEGMEKPVSLKAMPGNRPYKPYKVVPVVPEVVTEDCSRCGICAESCPAGAISEGMPDTTDASKCIGCMRCIALCPEQVRRIPEASATVLEEKLSPCRKVIKESECFI